MKAARLYAYIDIGIVAVCAIAPSESARVVGLIIHEAGLGDLIGVIALHASAIATLAMICSLARNYRGDQSGTRNRNVRLVLDLSVVVLFAYVIFKANSPGEEGAKDIADSYGSYLLSLIFCLGAGYAASDATRNIVNVN